MLATLPCAGPEGRFWRRAGEHGPRLAERRDPPAPWYNHDVAFPGAHLVRPWSTPLLYPDPTPFSGRASQERGIVEYDFEVADCFGKTVRLDHGNWERHVAKRPEIGPYYDRLAIVLRDPDVVVEDPRDGTHHFYRGGLTESLTKKPADQRSDAASGESWQHRRTLR